MFNKLSSAAIIGLIMEAIDWIAYVKGYKRRASYQKKRDKDIK